MLTSDPVRARGPTTERLTRWTPVEAEIAFERHGLDVVPFR